MMSACYFVVIQHVRLFDDIFPHPYYTAGSGLFKTVFGIRKQAGPISTTGEPN
jgi:hypothetical protein